MANKINAPGVFSCTPGVTENPLRIRALNNKWVGLGGRIRVIPEPPKIPYTIPEATQEDLRFLYEVAGLKQHIIFTPSSDKDVFTIQESNSGSTKGPTEDNRIVHKV